MSGIGGFVLRTRATVCSLGSMRGFTVMELMVVMAIVAVLAAIGYPAVIHGSRQFALIQCLGQVKRVGQGTLQFF